MRILIAEGNPEVLDYMSSSVMHNVTKTSNTEGLIDYLLYSDKEFDKIIIGDELTEQLPRQIDEEMLPKMKGDKSYFPVTLAKVCQNICKKKGKKVPEIIIATTCYYYEFYMKNDGRNFFSNDEISSIVRAFVEQNGFRFVSEQDTDEFYQFIKHI